MYVPTAPQQLRVPRPPRFVLLGVSLVAALVLWAVLSFSVAGNEATAPEPFNASAPGAVRAVAFLEHTPLESTLILYGATGSAGSRTIAAFERINGGPVYGAISPDAARAAVVHPAPHGGGVVSLLDMASGAAVTSPAIVDANTALSWSPSGESLLAVTSTPADATGRLSASLLLIDAASGATTTLTTFPSALQVAPVGFVPGSGAILAVVVD